jgi:ribosome-associated protein
VTAAKLADEKKAEDIQVIHVGERLKVADYFVVVTGQNRTHVRAIENDLHVRLKAIGERHKPLEGVDLGWWIVMDYSDVVVHVLQPEAREYYDIDHLYGDCPRVDWQGEDVPSLPTAREA